MVGTYSVFRCIKTFPKLHLYELIFIFVLINSMEINVRYSCIIAIISIFIIFAISDLISSREGSLSLVHDKNIGLYMIVYLFQFS